NRDVFNWRSFDSTESKIFIPFSQRHRKAIKEKRMQFSITKKARNQIYQYLEKFSEIHQMTDETGWNYNISTSEEVMRRIRDFYIPKYYDNQGEFVETDNLQNF